MHRVGPHLEQSTQPPMAEAGWRGYGNFFDEHKTELTEFFGTLGMEWDGTLGQAVEATQPWVRGGDHYTRTDMLELDDEQEAKVHGLYERMGFVNEIDLPAGEYDHMVVLGGLQFSNHRRLAHLERQLARDDIQLRGGVSLWGGVREMGDLEAKVVAEDRINAAAHDKPGAWWHGNTEAHGLRMSAQTQLGPLAVSRMDLKFALEGESMPDGPVVKNWFLDGENRSLLLLNARAVKRTGDPRHTTEECAAQWLQTVDLPEGARVGFITSNPYGRRTTTTVQRIVDKHDRSDIVLVGAGAAALPDAPRKVFDGELARNLYESQVA